MLQDLSPQTREQPSLLSEEAGPTSRDHSTLMETMDRIAQRWGKGAVAVGSAEQMGAWGGVCGKTTAHQRSTRPLPTRRTPPD